MCPPESIPHMRKQLKYDYSDQITDVNSLCNQSLQQIDSVLTEVEGVQSDPRAISMLDKLLQQHRDALTKIENCKQALLADMQE